MMIVQMTRIVDKYQLGKNTSTGSKPVTEKSAKAPKVTKNMTIGNTINNKNHFIMLTFFTGYALWTNPIQQNTSC